MWRSPPKAWIVVGFELALETAAHCFPLAADQNSTRSKHYSVDHFKAPDAPFLDLLFREVDPGRGLRISFI